MGPLWTIGHSTRSAGDFVKLLQLHGITSLADVRTIPRSRRHPHFSGEALAERLADDGIEYRHFPELGGLRKPRPDSPNTAWKNASFRGYADHMQTEGFVRGLDALLALAARATVAIMCAEAVWWQCHRMLLSDALVARGVEVRHIMSDRGPASAPVHRVTPFARISSGDVTYPGLI